ncbi:type VI secretion protein [Burkholderia contaminans FFH2055]|uniref:type VI secretion system baseplate subunit TssF n=1 Tax=Burkholderia contaminans TaxID=488447 RepID=UPI00062665CA|nr:type VI secretion system baseplate subunit TssF [Burkholderia contaminans]KKL35660.1 type VI secretion protein [Burkholderia contaminans FFH2055]MEB4636823.1 type VI secretion system baseplate subunit TssF [Burkholderia contaminans]MEB4651634.1 type VI secretion system baseplate subunit TssF [Burkholderia contaminans]MEB4661205.1 type VI secretion system baseplate subunit TssF [Burkholderia contaminans]MEB4667185.1 type VI secretion system baseplate subunit TssF [Burkholderia contaminans]
MDELLPHYEYELGLLAHGLTEFAARYPKIATRLGIQSGQVDDPHIGRLVQTFAFMASALDARLVDDYPEFTEALLDCIYPQFIQCVPSCALVEFDPAGLSGKLTGPFTVPRGTTLDARAALCRFRTIFDVSLTSLRIGAARYSPSTIAPAKVRLTPDATGILSITFTSQSATGLFDASSPSERIRVHLAGDRPVVASLADTLLLHTAGAFVEVDHDGRWLPLSKVPLEAAGFDDRETLLPNDAGGAGYSFRLLREYFAFPEKFDFVDIDFGHILRAARAPQARQLTLHVVTRGTPADSTTAQTLATVDARTFKLFCTPVVNLFDRAAEPILLTKTDQSYPITPVPLEDKGAPLGLYAIGNVYLCEKSDSGEQATLGSTNSARALVPPYRAFGHGSTAQNAYWIVSQDRDAAFKPNRAPWLLSLVGLDGRVTRPSQPQVDIDLLATNGDLPSQLPIGNPLGDLLNEGAALSCPITFISKPTAPMTPTCDASALWRVLSALSPHPYDLSQLGLSGLRTVLRLHAPQTALIAHQSIDAIRHLDYKSAVKWISLDGKMQSFVRGIEIAVSIDEAALRNLTLGTFARMLEQILTPYAPTNSYVQLTIRSTQTGGELLRCPARQGTRSLI